MSGEEEAPEVPVSDVMPCPICDGELVEISSVDTREGKEVICRCKTCGFEARFVKS